MRRLAVAVALLVGGIGMVIYALMPASEQDIGPEPFATIEDANVVGDVKWSPAGEMFAARNSKGVVVWDAIQGNQKTVIEQGGINDFGFPPNGDFLVTADRLDVKCWNIPSGKLVAQIRHNGQWFESKDCTRIATRASNGFQIWNTTTGKPGVLIQKEKSASLYGARIHFSPDGKVLALTQRGRMVVYDALTGKALGEYGGVNQDMVIFSNNGSRMAFAASRKVLIWNCSTGDEVCQLASPTPSALWFTADGTALAVQTYSRLDVWRGLDFQEKLTISQPGIRSAAWSPTGDFIAVCSNSLLGVWDATNGKAASSFDAANVKSAHFTTDDKLLLLAGDELSVCNLTLGELRNVDTPALRALYLSEDNRLAAGVTNKGEIVLWRHGTATTASTLLRAIAGVAGGICAVVGVVLLTSNLMSPVDKPSAKRASGADSVYVGARLHQTKQRIVAQARAIRESAAPIARNAWEHVSRFLAIAWSESRPLLLQAWRHTFVRIPALRNQDIQARIVVYESHNCRHAGKWRISGPMQACYACAGTGELGNKTFIVTRRVFESLVPIVCGSVSLLLMAFLVAWLTGSFVVFVILVVLCLGGFAWMWIKSWDEEVKIEAHCCERHAEELEANIVIADDQLFVIYPDREPAKLARDEKNDKDESREGISSTGTDVQTDNKSPTLVERMREELPPISLDHDGDDASNDEKSIE